MATAVAPPARLSGPASERVAPVPAEQFRRSVSAPTGTGTVSASSSASSSPLRPSTLPEDAEIDGSVHSVHSVESQGMTNRSEEYRLLFRLPADELLIQDFNCAVQENILIQGHMYIFIRHVCFYSNIFGFETKKIIPLQEVTALRKAKTASIFPNAIEIVAGERKQYFFGSFLSRDEAFRVIAENWVQQNSDAKAFLERQDTKTSGVTEDTVSNSVEGSRAPKPGEDVPPSERNSDAKLSDITVANGIVENGSTNEVSAQQENGNGNSLSSLNPFTLQSQDVNAPNVPENFVMLAEQKFPIPLEDFFMLLLSDSARHLLDDFRMKCGDKEFNCTTWRQDEESGLVRDVSFLHPIKLYLGAKFGSCKEVQKLRLYRKSHIVIETSQQINDAPFGDHFTVEGFWDIRQDAHAENSCTLRIYLNVAFSKRTIFKGRIEQATKDECREVYALWITLAQGILKRRNASATGAGAESVHLSQSAPSVDGPSSTETPGGTQEESHTVHSARDEVNPTVIPQIAHPLPDDLARASPSASHKHRLWHSATGDSRTNFPPLLVTMFIGILLLMQVSIIIVLLRSPKVIVVGPESSQWSPGGHSRVGAEWVRSRLSSLGNEMRMAEAYMEQMRQEYAWLQEHLARLERLAGGQEL